MTIKAIVDFDDPTNFTFNSSELAVANNTLHLLDITPASETSYFNFNTDGDFSPTRGNFSLTKSGSTNVQGGVLEFFNANTDYVTAPSSFMVASQGSIHFKFIPNFNSLPSQTNVFSMKDRSGGGLAGIEVYLSNQGGGISRVTLKITDDAGANVLTSIVALNSFAVGQPVDMFLNYNLIVPDIRFFLDGVQTYSNIISTGTLTFSPTYEFRMGYDATVGPGTPNYKIDDLQITNASLKIGDPLGFSVPVEEAFNYGAGPYKLVVNPLITMDAISGFAELAELNTGNITYLFKFNSVPYWWDGAAWSISDTTFAQSNTAADIAANSATLPISNGVSARLEIFMQPGDRYLTPELDQVCIEYHFFLDSTSPVVCDVYGTVKDNSGSPVGGAKVTFDTEDHFYGENFIAPSVTVFTGANGVFVAPIIETATTGLGASCTIEYRDSGKKKLVKYTDITIPNTLIARLSDLV